MVGNKKKNTPEVLMQKYGMKMNMKDGEMKMGMNDKMSMKDGKMNDQMDMKMGDTMGMKKDSMSMSHNGASNKMEGHMHNMPMMQKDSTSFDYEERKTYFNYDFLEAKEKTEYKADLPVNEVLLNLTGNMNRYVWSMNGVPLLSLIHISEPTRPY